MSKDKERKPDDNGDRKPIDLGVEPHPVPQTTEMGRYTDCCRCDADEHGVTGTNNSDPSGTDPVPR